MSSAVRLLVLVVILNVPTVGAWPHGAPESACESLLPGHHGESSQTTQPPFRIDVDRTAYRPGDTVTITLIALGSEKFIGFLLETRAFDKDEHIGGYVGRLTPPVATQHVRGCGPASLTHTNSNSQYFTNLTLEWTAPDKSPSSFIVRATFVKSFDTFWIDVKSPVVYLSALRDSDGKLVKQQQRLSSSTVLSKPTTTAATKNTSVPQQTWTFTENKYTDRTGKTWNKSLGVSYCQNLSLPIRKDVECGRSKGCFVSCDSYSCDYVVSWVPTEGGDWIDFDIVAKVTETGDQWMAIGFSDDIEMGDDGVVECVIENDIVSVYQSYNYAYYNVRRPKPFDGLSKTEGCLQDGVFWCKFSRRKKMDNDNVLKKFDLDKKWIVMFANGQVRYGEKQMHLLSPRYGPWTSGRRVDFTEPGVSGQGGGSYLLIRLHGSLMVIAWILAASIGILAARYYRDDWPTVTPFQHKLWFLIHRTCLVTTFILVLVGFFIIYEEADRGLGPISQGRASGHTFDAIHPSLGIATLCLTFVNPVMAVFRPHSEDKRRPIFNWAHRIFGVVTFFSALLTITFGLGMQKAGVSDIGLYVMGGYGLYQCLIAVCLELFGYVKGYLQNDNSVDLAESEFEHQTLIEHQEKLHKKENPTFWVWRTAFFVGHCVILVAVSVLLIVLISTSGLERWYSAVA